MFDIGWTELLVIAGVTLLVVGPKELPQMLRTAMQALQKLRGLGAEFQAGVQDLVRQAEIEDLKKSVESAQSIGAGSPQTLAERLFDPTTGDMMKDIEAALRADAALVSGAGQSPSPQTVPNLAPLDESKPDSSRTP